MADQEKQEELYHLTLDKNQLQGLLALATLGEITVKSAPAMHPGGVAVLMNHEQSDKFHMCLSLLAGCESQQEFQRTDDNELDYRIRTTIRSTLKALAKIGMLYWKDNKDTTSQLAEVLKRMQARS